MEDSEYRTIWLGIAGARMRAGAGGGDGCNGVGHGVSYPRGSMQIAWLDIECPRGGDDRACDIGRVANRRGL